MTAGQYADGSTRPGAAPDPGLLVDMVPSHLWCLTPEGEPVYFNKRMVTFLGLDVEDTDRPGASRLDVMIRTVVHPEDAEEFRAAIDRSLAEGENFVMTYRLRRADGVYRWMSSRAEPMLDKKGRIVQWYGVCHEIDDQMRTHKGPPSLDFVHPEDRSAAAQATAYAFWTGVPQIVSCRQRQADGGYAQTELRLDPGYGVSVDVEPMVFDPGGRWSALKSYGETIEAVRSAKIIESLYGKAWAFDARGRFTYVTPAAQTAIGMTLEDLNAPVRGGEFVEGGDVGWSLGVHPDDYPQAAEALRHCLRTGEHWNVEYRMRRTNGNYVWHRISARPTRDAEGRITGWFGTSIDIDIYKRTEAMLRERQRELTQIVDMVPVHIRRLTPEGEPTFFNKRLIDFYGLDLKDVVKPGQERMPTVINALVHPEDASRLIGAVRHSMSSGEPYSMKYRLRRADGVYRWVDGRAEPLRDENGAIVHWYAISIDIDDEMRAQEALRERERELSHLVDMVPSFLWRLTPEGEPIFYNKRLVDFLGLDAPDCDKPGMSRLAAVVEAAFHPDDAPDVIRAIEHSLATGDSFSMRYRLRRADGVYRWMSGRAEPMRDESGKIVQWYGLSHDIDDQVRAEEALRASKQQLEQMIDAVPVNILSFDPSGKLTYASKRYLENVGTPAGTIDAFDALAMDVAHPDDFPEMFRRAKEGFATGTPFVNRFRRRDAQGAYPWIEARAQPLRDGNGEIIQWYIASIDIEDEMRAQRELRERERMLFQLVETLPVMIDCAGPDGEPIYRSRQLSEYLGYDLKTLDEGGASRLSGTLDSGVHPDDLAGVKENYAHCLSTGEPYARKHRLRRHDGEYRWVDTRAAPMRNAAGEIVQWNVTCLDIDREVRAQEELRLAQETLARASQTASLAELSASIAHEVNQPLAAIVANSHACHRWLSAAPPNVERAKATAERIIRDANSAADVISHIRALFRQTPQPKSLENVNTIISEVCRLMTDQFGARAIRVETALEPALPPIALDRVQIQQVVVNLIRNGIEAMDGVIERPRLLEIRSNWDGSEAVRVEIRDTGTGFESADRAFDAFFTTKRNGMGMGLAICRSIIEAHGGRLWVADNQTAGATVGFALPVQGLQSPAGQA